MQQSTQKVTEPLIIDLFLMKEIKLLGTTLRLLPERALYLSQQNLLLVSDVHLGKSENFQALGVPIPNSVNQASLDRLHRLCMQLQPDQLIILGDLFHSKLGLVDEVIDAWLKFINSIEAKVVLLVGNHDRPLLPTIQQLSMDCIPDAIQLENIILSHEPNPQEDCINICGHIHPCVRIKTKLDSLRLPCFYVDHSRRLLMLPSFGEFTGGHDLPITSASTAYVIVEQTIVAFGR
ncbi:MAG TPA: ligase-associated DNA damage response endonuclease PdeM [Chroococcidiopsis sp.]